MTATEEINATLVERLDFYVDDQDGTYTAKPSPSADGEYVSFADWNNLAKRCAHFEAANDALKLEVADLLTLLDAAHESNRLYETIFTERGTVRLYAGAIVDRVKRARAALSHTAPERA